MQNGGMPYLRTQGIFRAAAKRCEGRRLSFPFGKFARNVNAKSGTKRDIVRHRKRSPECRRRGATQVLSNLQFTSSFGFSARRRISQLFSLFLTYSALWKMGNGGGGSAECKVQNPECRIQSESNPQHFIFLPDAHLAPILHSALMLPHFILHSPRGSLAAWRANPPQHCDGGGSGSGGFSWRRCW
jgi:hypothetical protein